MAWEWVQRLERSRLALATGPAENIAAAITASAAFLRLPMMAVVAIGVAAVIALRALL